MTLINLNTTNFPHTLKEVNMEIQKPIYLSPKNTLLSTKLTACMDEERKHLEYPLAGVPPAQMETLNLK